MQTLADHPDYRITLHRAKTPGSDKLLLTFGGQPSDIADKGFGTNYALSQGWDTVFVAPRKGSQFQGLSLDDFKAAVTPILPEWPDIICYGSSLGAYAALYYGGCINARIIAAAPMLPLWSQLNIRSYADLNHQHLALTDTPLSDKTPVVIYDPMSAHDRLMVDDMVTPAYPDARRIQIPYGGHTVLVSLSMANILKPLLLGLIHHDQIIDFDPPGDGTAMYHAERGAHLTQTDAAGARDEFLKSLAIFPTKKVFNKLIGCLVQMGDLATAQAQIDAAAETEGANLDLVPHVRKKATEAGLRL